MAGGTYFGPMEENRARRVADALRARGINAHFAEVGTRPGMARGPARKLSSGKGAS